MRVGTGKWERGSRPGPTAPALLACAVLLACLVALVIQADGPEGGLTLALLVPGTAAIEPDVLAAQTRDGLAGCGEVRVAVETWRPGDSGDAVIARARVALGAAGEPTR